MQTFLVSNDLTFSDTMRCLDNRRLGKQRIEARQILTALCTPTGGWRNHPATKMWAGCVPFLAFYHDRCIEEWKLRGFNNTMTYLTTGSLEPFMQQPSWWNDQAFFAAHRSNLLRKDPAHYGQFGWKEPDNLPYIWPTAGEPLDG